MAEIRRFRQNTEIIADDLGDNDIFILEHDPDGLNDTDKKITAAELKTFMITSEAEDRKESDTTLQSNIDNLESSIKSGDIVSGKAENDKDGNNITATYAPLKSAELTGTPTIDGYQIPTIDKSITEYKPIVWNGSRLQSGVSGVSGITVVSVNESSTASPTEDTRYIITDNSIEFSLGTGAYPGIRAEVINATSGNITINNTILCKHADVTFTYIGDSSSGYAWKPRLSNESDFTGTSSDDPTEDGIYTADIDGLALVQGAEVTITFSNTNTYSGQPSININGAGAGLITIQGTAMGVSDIVSGKPLTFAVNIAEDNTFTFDCINSPLISRPIGSLYWSSNSTSPATLFGGTWEQIKDKFIYAAGTYSAGATGGASEGKVTLTTANLPSHNHKLTNGTAKFTGTSGTTSSNGAHTHTSYYYRGNTKSGGFWATGDTVMYNPYDAGSTTSSAGAHSHTFTPSGSISGQTDSTGSGTSFSIMPPYLVMYCWKRTA